MGVGSPAFILATLNTRDAPEFERVTLDTDEHVHDAEDLD